MKRTKISAEGRFFAATDRVAGLSNLTPGFTLVDHSAIGFAMSIRRFGARPMVSSVKTML